MNKPEEYLSSIADIKNLMERSSRFLSLSGLTGVFAGIFAIIGAVVAYVYLDYSWMYSNANPRIFNADQSIHSEFIAFLLINAISVLCLALGSGLYFTYRKSKKQNLPLWDASAKHMIINLFIPLAAGGMFCLILLYHQIIFLIAPVTLLFYGLALINASRYTLQDIRYLGLVEISLGLLGALFPGYGLLLWTLGFGVLHIVYGLIMYKKYE
ncbi:MAG: hypothetical protein ACEPOZ_21115 [Marinifilaceae bacterium]